MSSARRQPVPKANSAIRRRSAPRWHTTYWELLGLEEPGAGGAASRLRINTDQQDAVKLVWLFQALSRQAAVPIPALDKIRDAVRNL